MGLLHDLEDGKKREITETDFDYFLDVLPPVALGFRWKGEWWSFGFAEGDDFVYAFKKEGGTYYAQKTELRNQWECGVSIEDQQEEGFGRRLKEEKERGPNSGQYRSA